MSLECVKSHDFSLSARFDAACGNVKARTANLGVPCRGFAGASLLLPVPSLCHDM